jgi:pimeloyl-ACP methyl ester carboxylesterase
VYTFVLIHGGFCGGWCWKKVKNFLEHAGHRVYTPTLTGLGELCHHNGSHVNLDIHIRDIHNLLFFEEVKDAILVGHSYGGLVITGVASGADQSRISQLVYLDALVPHEGDSLMSLVDIQTADFYTQQVTQKGEGWFVPPLDIRLKDEDDAVWFTQRLTPQAFSLCTHNTHQTIKDMSTRARTNGWTLFELDSNHFPMISTAEQLSQLLLEIAQR